MASSGAKAGDGGTSGMRVVWVGREVDGGRAPWGAPGKRPWGGREREGLGSERTEFRGKLKAVPTLPCVWRCGKKD